MTSPKDKRNNSDVDESKSNNSDIFLNSVEVLRKCSRNDAIDLSWDNSCYVSFDNTHHTPPLVNAMVAEMSTEKVDHSTQTIDIKVDVSLSFSKHLTQGSSNENSDDSLGGTSRKKRSHKWLLKTRPWKLMDICTWIGKKSYQSITGFLRDNIFMREPDKQDFLKEMKQQVDKMQQSVDRNNQCMAKMLEKFHELEESSKKELKEKLNASRPALPLFVLPPPPPLFVLPPPPPPPPPPKPPSPSPPLLSKIPVRSHNLPRCGSALPKIAGPRFTITPQDIANVKLRKPKNNPFPAKPVNKEKQPLVTVQMLQSTRVKLRSTRPVASSTPKQLQSDLEKCLLQEPSGTTLFRRRKAMRPHHTIKGPRSPRSPSNSPRLNSLPRRTPHTPVSTLKLPNGVPEFQIE